MKRVESFGVIVGFLGGLSALCAKANVSDAFVRDCSQHVVPGQTVLCFVTEVCHCVRVWCLSSLRPLSRLLVV